MFRMQEGDSGGFARQRVGVVRVCWWGGSVLADCLLRLDWRMEGIEELHRIALITYHGS